MTLAPAAEFSVTATDLVRSFGSRRAVNGVSLSLSAGDCLALFGPNGAGKTTLLRMLGGLLRPTSGQATIEGVALPGGVELRARVGLVSHQTMLYDALTARENVEFAARMYGVADVRQASQRVLQRLGAESFADLRVQSLSRGMQQRVSVARAIVHEPSLLLADEPFTGLDAGGASALTRMLADLRDSGATIIIVTHNLDEALALCTAAAIMREGRFVRLDRTPIPARDEYTALYRELSVDAS
ncbi:MAG: ABC transporter ATP-binding protein [Gemmatimonadaceae bacterium]